MRIVQDMPIYRDAQNFEEFPVNMAGIRRTSAVDEVFLTIQDKIHNGDYPVGHIFPPQKQLAVEYGVSASTVREALGKLTMLGYLSAKQGVGTAVISNTSAGQVSSLGQYVFLSSSELVHFVEARLCLERSALRSAAYQATKSDLERLENIIEEQKQAVDKLDSALFSRHDKDFHMELMSIGRNPILVQYMVIIRDGLFSFIEEATRMEDVMKSSIGFHQMILDRLKTGQAFEAEKKLVEHLWDVIKTVESNLGHDTGLSRLFEREFASLRPGC